MFEGFVDRFLETLLELSAGTVYLLVGVFSWAEAAFFLGFVTPGEFAIAGGGVLAAHGNVALTGVIAAAILGTSLGNTTGYWLGRLWGTRILAWPPLVGVIGGVVARTREFMNERGEWAIVASRLTSFTRIVVPFLAGASRMPYRRFVLFDLPAGALWATTWVVLGFILGESWRALLDRAGAAAFLVLILFVLGLIIRAIAVRIAGNQRRVEAAFHRALRVTGLTGVARALTPGFFWVVRRLHPGLALGLNLTLGFAVLIVAIAGVGFVLGQTQAVRGLALLDFPVLDWMVATRTDEAVGISRTALRAFHWPGVIILALPVTLFLAWKGGGPPAARAAVGLLGAALGAFLLDRFVLEGVVPRAEFPSVPVAVAAALLVHVSASAGTLKGWGAAVGATAGGVFVMLTVALGTIVAGWAAPSGIALGMALGLGWASLIEVQGRLVQALGAVALEVDPNDGGEGQEVRPTDAGGRGPDAPTDQARA